MKFKLIILGVLLIVATHAYIFNQGLDFAYKQFENRECWINKPENVVSCYAGTEEEGGIYAIFKTITKRLPGKNGK